MSASHENGTDQTRAKGVTSFSQQTGVSMDSNTTNTSHLLSRLTPGVLAFVNRQQAMSQQVAILSHFEESFSDDSDPRVPLLVALIDTLIATGAEEAWFDDLRKRLAARRSRWLHMTLYGTSEGVSDE